MWTNRWAVRNWLARLTVALVALVAARFETIARADELTFGIVFPVVVRTVPQAGATDVDPALGEIRVTFSKEMRENASAFIDLAKFPDAFPKTVGAPQLLEDKRTWVLQVKLEPGKTYGLVLNPENRQEKFLDTDGLAAQCYLLVFKTAAAGNAAAGTGESPLETRKTAGAERSDNGLAMKFCWCPPGKFTMGSPRSEKYASTTNEQVEVTLTQGFWLGKTEVTQGQWIQLMGTETWKGAEAMNDPFRGKEGVKTGRDFAASYVNWDDASEFCRKLTAQERTAGRLPSGWSYRLPTEAQWEYACRAGTTTPFSFGADESQLGDYAWYDKSANGIGEDFAHGVGLKKPNAWGLHDMHGNVFEWCQDWFEEKLPGGRNPEVRTAGSERAGPGAFRVYRGGSWSFAAFSCPSAFRRGIGTGNYRLFYQGFRVACGPSGQ